MKRLFYLIALLLASTASFTACSETDEEEDVKYSNWEARNTAYFDSIMGVARTAIAEAKATYGDDWEDHCDWRLYRTYAQDASQTGTSSDSIAVQISKRGTGSGCPIYTDSVRVNYLVRLIPNALSDKEEEQTLGEIVGYTGVSKDSTSIFSEDFCTPVAVAVSNNLEGISTALMYMHIGDLWRVYLPCQLGNGTTPTSYIPAYSTLIYALELKAYYHKGTVVPDWR